jgi:SAM-dependent methyltransferase
MSAAGGYHPDLFAATARVDQKHFWYRARRNVIAAALGSVRARLPQKAVALEVGCGAGAVLPVLADYLVGAVVVGVDPFSDGLHLAAARTGLPMVRAAGDALPFAKVDFIGAFDVLEHVDDAKALHAAREALGPGGTLLVTVPAHPSLWSDFDVASGHLRRYTRGSLAGVLACAGFQVTYLTYFMSLLYAPARLRRSLSEREPETLACVDAELSVGRFTNSLAYTLLLPEARAVRLRRRLPIGTSLLAEAVAR